MRLPKCNSSQNQNNNTAEKKENPQENKLGTTTRYRASVRDPEKRKKPDNNDEDGNDLAPFKGFVDRWVMHSIAKAIVMDVRINIEAVKIHETGKKYGYSSVNLPRICKCMHCLIPMNSTVQVRKDPEKKLAHYGGLMACGSVWVCPLCASKVSENRKNELIEACNTWTEMGENHSKVHVVFTIPHYAEQSLAYVQKNFMAARRKFKEQKVLKRNPELKVYRLIAQEYGIKGAVTGVEVTTGFNGWHVHSHDLFFLDRELSAEQIVELKKDITEAWIYAIQKTKHDFRCTIDEIREKSIIVTQAKSPADYIAKFGLAQYEENKEILQKWGAAEELTKSHIKKGKRKGKTPWDLLRKILENPNDNKIYLHNAHKWHEYTKVFHGKRQLYYSKGFRYTLKLGESKSDQELVELKDKETILLGLLQKADWRKVVKNRKKAELLIFAAKNDWTKVEEFIANLKD